MCRRVSSRRNRRELTKVENSEGERGNSLEELRGVDNSEIEEEISFEVWWKFRNCRGRKFSGRVEKVEKEKFWNFSFWENNEEIKIVFSLVGLEWVSLLKDFMDEISGREY